MKISIFQCRLNPPHLCHVSLLKYGLQDGNDLVYCMIIQGKKSSEDKKRNPLSFDLKKKVIDNSNVNAIVLESTSASVPLMIYKILSDPKTQNEKEFEFTLYCGSDRVKGYERQMVEKYFDMAKTDSNREDITVSGEVKAIPRDIVQISGSQVRELIISGNDLEAKRWMPFKNDLLYNEVKDVIIKSVTEQIKKRVNIILEQIGE